MNKSTAHSLSPESVHRSANLIRQVLAPLFRKDNTIVVIPAVLLAEFIVLLEVSPWVRERVRQTEWVFDDHTECLTLHP